MSKEFQYEPVWRTYIHVVTCVSVALNGILTTGVGRMWIGFIWLRIGAIGRRL